MSRRIGRERFCRRIYDAILMFCGSNRSTPAKTEGKQDTRARNASWKPSALHVFAAQCVRRIIARGLLVFLLFSPRRWKRKTAESRKAAFSHAQSWRNFPTEKSFPLPFARRKNFFRWGKVSSRILAKHSNLVTIFRWVIDLKAERFCETFVRVENYWRKVFIERSKKGKKIYKVPSTESDPLSVLALLLHITHIINFLCIVWDSLLPFLSRGGAQQTIKILVKLHKLLQKLSSGSRFLDKLRYPKRLFTRIACSAS